MGCHMIAETSAVLETPFEVGVRCIGELAEVADNSPLVVHRAANERDEQPSKRRSVKEM